jgi:hypothetical protein
MNFCLSVEENPSFSLQADELLLCYAGSALRDMFLDGNDGFQLPSLFLANMFTICYFLKKILKSMSHFSGVNDICCLLI